MVCRDCTEEAELPRDHILPKPVASDSLSDSPLQVQVTPLTRLFQAFPSLAQLQAILQQSNLSHLLYIKV